MGRKYKFIPQIPGTLEQAVKTVFAEDRIIKKKETPDGKLEILTMNYSKEYRRNRRDD